MDLGFAAGVVVMSVLMKAGECFVGAQRGTSQSRMLGFGNAMRLSWRARAMGVDAEDR